MQDSSDFATIIFLGLAAFVIWRLYSVLGMRTGHENKPTDMMRPSAGAAENKVVQLPNARSAPEEEPVVQIDPDRWRGYAETDSPVAAGLDAIAAADGGFDATFDDLPNTTTTAFTLALDGGAKEVEIAREFDVGGELEAVDGAPGVGALGVIDHEFLADGGRAVTAEPHRTVEDAHADRLGFVLPEAEAVAQRHVGHGVLLLHFDF